MAIYRCRFTAYILKTILCILKICLPQDLKFRWHSEQIIFAGDKLIFRTWYRNYHDDWGIKSNTIQLETVYKITPFFSVTPFYRYYQQSAADQFAGFQQHTTADEFYTSNYDLSKFNSNFYGAGFRIAPPNGVFKIKHLNSLEIRYGHYGRTTGMNSDIVTLHLKFK